jgi:SH3-like domain-containing protein
LAQGLLELYLKTAICQYLESSRHRCERVIPGLFGGGGWIKKSVKSHARAELVAHWKRGRAVLLGR